MIYLHKILPLIISPLFLIIFLIVLGAILRSKKISFLGIVILLFCSLPIVSSKLIAYLVLSYYIKKSYFGYLSIFKLMENQFYIILILLRYVKKQEK